MEGKTHNSAVYRPKLGRAMLDANKKALWEKYFPDEKPSSEQYILLLGHAHEHNEDIPYLLDT